MLKGSLYRNIMHLHCSNRSTLYTQVTNYATVDDVAERAHQGCFVAGLYLEGAGWDRARACLVKQKAKQLVEDLPILKVIPIESYKLKLQVFPRRVLLPLHMNCLQSVG